MDIKIRGKYEDKPLKLKNIRPMLKNLRIQNKFNQKDGEDENHQNPQNYAEYKTSTTGKKVAEKSILAVTFSAKRLKFKGKQTIKADTTVIGGSVISDSTASTIFLKKQKENRRVHAAAAIKQHAVQQSVVQSRSMQRKRKRNYRIRCIKRQIRNQTVASSSVVLLAMVLFVFTLSMFFFLADDGEGNIEAGQPALMVSVAKSQIGNEGGEKYWRWYGFTGPVDWCACFVSWCANEAGLIEENMVPKFAEVNEGVQWFEEKDKWIEVTEELNFTPKPETLIFFDWDGDGMANHVGIVETCRNGMIYTIEGNSSNVVAGRCYIQSSGYIMGYGKIDITSVN